MSSNFYANSKQRSVKFAYEDDPTFQEFRSTVNAKCSQKECEPIKTYLLYRIWYAQRTFHGYWNSPPTRDTTNRVIWILAHSLQESETMTTDVQGLLIVLAWYGRHGVKFPDYNRFVREIFEREWLRIQPDVEEARLEKNKKRRETRAMRKGRPLDTNEHSLRQRILAALKEYPTTTASLAHRLETNPKTIDGQLQRMLKKGEVTRLQRGLYQLATQENGAA